MPSVYDLKPKFQSLLRPITNRLASLGVTANQVTLSAVVLSVSVGIVLVFNADLPTVWWLVPITMLVRMALNAIDGMLAREHDQKSRLGAILNEVGDVVSDAALYLPLALCPLVPPSAAVVFVVIAIVTEYVGVVAIQIGASRRYDGPMGKSDRAFWVSVLAVGIALGWVSKKISAVLLVVLIGLSIWTVINRSRRALAEGEIDSEALLPPPKAASSSPPPQQPNHADRHSDSRNDPA